MRIRKAVFIDIIIAIYVFCVIAADTGSVTMKMARLMLMGAFVVKALYSNKVKITQYVLRLFVFCLFAALSVVWAESTNYALSMSVTLLINALCICSLMNLIDNKQARIDLVLNCMIIAPLLLELRVIWSGGVFAFLDTRNIGKISGNTVGLCAAFGACFAIYYWLQGRRRKQYMSLFVINCLIVVLSASRKALLCICIPIAILFVCNRKDSAQVRIRKCFGLLILGIVGLIAVMKIPLLYDLIGERIEGMFALLSGNVDQADASSESRSLLITWGMEWFREKPLLGYGIDNYRIILVKNHPSWPIDYYAHNNYVEMLVDVGIVGFIIYYWNYAKMLCRGIKRRSRMTNRELLIFGMFIALVVSEYALVSYFDKYVQVFLLMIWMLMMEGKKDNGADARSGGKDMSKLEKFLQDPRSLLRRILAVGNFKWLPDKPYLKLMYYAQFGKKLNLDNPTTFNEKMQWLKLYNRKPEYSLMVDKYEAKKYVAERIGEEYIIPTLGVWDNVEDIDFDALPDQFVLKCTHDCGSIVICRDKSQFDQARAKEKLKKSMAHEYFYWGREWPYKNVKPRIIAEQFMVDESGVELKDYKLFAFDGDVKALFIATDRGIDTRFDFYDKDFNHLPILNGHPNASKEIHKPNSFDEMKRLASKLSKGIPHLRVDFYDINGKIYFGELTFYHWSGFTAFEPEEWDERFGSWISLPPKSGNVDM